MKLRFSVPVLLAVFISASIAQQPRKTIPAPDYPDLVYKTIDDKPLCLDLYLPAKQPKPTPVIIWVHGGGWRNGSKKQCLPVRLGFTEKGYAIASIDYRLTDAATFPAQIEDCKAAIRWLRAHADEYKLDADHFGAWGSSAGGHLAALLGTTGDLTEFDTGDNLNFSSRVQAVCDDYGPSDFGTISTPKGFERHTQPNSPVSLLLGGTVQEKPDLAKAASPISHATPDDPPFLIVHGDQDRVVPVQQSRLLDKILRESNVESELIIIPEAGHGGPQFATPEMTRNVADFFEKHLK